MTNSILLFPIQKNISQNTKNRGRNNFCSKCYYSVSKKKNKKNKKSCFYACITNVVLLFLTKRCFLVSIKNHMFQKKIVLGTEIEKRNRNDIRWALCMQIDPCNVESQRKIQADICLVFCNVGLFIFFINANVK